MARLLGKVGVLSQDGSSIDPYEKMLTTASKAEKQRWAEQVMGLLESRGFPR